MKNIWLKLNPKHRRFAVIAGAFAVFALIMMILPSSEERERNVKKEEPAVRAILTDREDGDARFERLMAQLENIRSENRQFSKEFERIQRDLERFESGSHSAEVNKELQAMADKIEELESRASQYEGVDGTVIIGGTGQPASNDETPVVPEPVRQPMGLVVDEPGVPTQAQMWDQPVASVAFEEGARGRGPDRDAPPQVEMRVIEAPVKELTEEEKEALKKEDDGVYIPAGSIITGTLITGMDAPTGRQARQEPHPALLRIKHEAILPNRFRADVRECFVLLGGYGDLSSERAYLRGETISCVRNDGKVVESSLESFTVGEDGKAGVRGRLVSKQGAMLSKALAAGMIEGFAEAFDRVPVPTLSLDSGDRQLYQQAFSSDGAQSGAVAGVGKALDRLAQFYIDQAEGMFPVIEIDAGREVEVVMIRGGKLALK